MRTLRIAALLMAVLAGQGASALPVLATDDAGPSIRPVAGTLDVHRLPGGTFDVQDRVFQYREYPLAGNGVRFSDSRLSGYLMSDWNWDVLASGDQPVPAWGTITINGRDGSWSGTFTGIRPSDFEPVDIRALLYGEGAYDGLCATLDISVVDLAWDGTWIIDGVVHPVDMSG